MSSENFTASEWKEFQDRLETDLILLARAKGVTRMNTDREDCGELWRVEVRRLKKAKKGSR